VKETYSPPVSEFPDKNDFARERIYAKRAGKPGNVSFRRETFRSKDRKYVETVSTYGTGTIAASKSTRK
jgi:hypothetical protein